MDRILTPVSDSELARRWDALRALMARRGLDALLFQATNDWLGGGVKWVTDIPANNGYPRTVLFYRDGPMSVVEMGAFGVTRALGGADPAHRGVGAMHHTPSFLSIDYTVEYDAELAARDLTAHGVRSLGLVNGKALPHGFVERLRRDLPGAAFSDPTVEVETLKAIKSGEERDLIRATARLQDAVFAKVLDSIKPGMRDIDVTALAQQEGQRLGSEQGIFLCGSAPLGVRAGFLGRHMQGRTLNAGDHISLLVEINGAGGFFTEIARTIVLGKASAELKRGFFDVKAAQDHSLSLMKPGASCAAVFAAHNRYMIEKGLPPETRLYAHGQGYDMVERPLIRQDEDMRLAEGMCLAVHPGYETPEMFAVICDNYFIEAHGPSDCLHKTPKQIFEV